MTEIQKLKQYDLEERTFKFAKMVRNFVKELTKSIGNIEDGKQLVRASGSVGANYIEANESLSKKDFLMRIKICRKEAKESGLWVDLVEVGENLEMESWRSDLYKESKELCCIFGSIVTKASQ